MRTQLINLDTVCIPVCIQYIERDLYIDWVYIIPYYSLYTQYIYGTGVCTTAVPVDINILAHILVLVLQNNILVHVYWVSVYV